MKALLKVLMILALVGIGTVGICKKNSEVSAGRKESFAETEDFLIMNGPNLISNGQYKRVLDLIENLPTKNVQIRTIECFANLKGWTSENDMICKMNFGALRQKIIMLRDNEATPSLMIFLKNEDSSLRKYAAELLGWIGDERALNDLREVAEHDEKFGVRKYAKWAYERISGEKFK